jgi:protocatechuate 3,4-dioxygenase beta subunit
MKKVLRLFVFFMIAASVFLAANAQPSAPKNLVAQKASFQNMVSVKLQWSPSSIMNAMNWGLYNIYRKNGALSDTGKFEKIYARVEGTIWFDYLAQRGETYCYYVTAINSQGESNPSDTVEISLDSALVKAVVTGKVTNVSNGNAIANAKVLLIPVMGWGAQEQRTDNAGNYKFRSFPGKYLLYIAAPGFYPEYYNDVKNIFNATKIVLQSGDSVNIDVSLQAVVPPQKYMLSGTVKDTAGNPLQAIIEVYRLVHNSFSHRDFDDMHKDFDAVTDSAGNYSVKVNAGDTVVVFAHAKSKGYFSQYYNDKSSFLDADRIGISGDTSNINFVLKHKPVFENGISGTILNSDSNAVSSIVLAIRISGSKTGPRKYNAITDSLGNYSMTNLVPGNYILLAIPQGDYLPTFFKYDGTQTLLWKNADSVIVDSNSLVTGINFTVMDEPDSGAATVSGNVTDNQGNPMVGVIVFATDQNRSIFSFGITDQKGNYTICGLIPGSYTITSDSYDYTSSSSSSATLNYSTADSTTATASFILTPETVTGIVSSTPAVIQNYTLYQNYPNPFNPSTTISYFVPSAGKVVLKIYNILGDEVTTLVNGEQEAGTHRIVFNAANLASGVYFYQIRAGNFVATKKLILLK